MQRRVGSTIFNEILLPVRIRIGTLGAPSPYYFPNFRTSEVRAPVPQLRKHDAFKIRSAFWPLLVNKTAKAREG